MKKAKRYLFLRSLFGSVFLAIAGLILLLNPDLGSAAAAWIVGGALLAAGAVYLLICVFSWPVPSVMDFLAGIAGTILGIYILCRPLALAALLGIVLGGYLLIQGLGVLRESLLLRRAGAVWLPHLILSLVTAVLALRLIFYPLTASRLVMVICGLALLSIGIFYLILRIRAARLLHLQDKNSDIIDAEP